jgi:tripartite-type tricarboxylate transporter receptor subunit TctC
MRYLRIVTAMFLVGALAPASNTVSGQSYPNKPIRIVTTEAGGGNDFAARIVAQGLTAALGQQVIIENRGGTVLIPTGMVIKAPADGYTLLFHGNPVWFLPLLQDNVPYDPLKDFSPITLVDISPLVLVVHPSIPIKSTKELVALAKAKPGALNYAAGVTGSTPHLAAELFKSIAAVNITRVSYKGVGPALTDMISGETQMMFVTTAAGMPHVKSGRLRALAVTSAKPSAVVPGLPTVASAGLRGYESINTHGMFAPPKTPAAVISRLHQETARFLQMPETKERFLSAGVEPVGSTPEAFAAAIKAEMVMWGKVIKDNGIRLE